jgi:ATP-dependent Clp protease ATP-binding subunit ClpA
MHSTTPSAVSGRPFMTDSTSTLAENPPLKYLAELLPLERMTAECSTALPWLVVTSGIRAALQELLRILHQSRLHHGFVVGPRGSGKTSLLRLFSQEILRVRPDIRQVIYLDAANVGVEDSRAVLETLLTGLQNQESGVLLIDNLSSLLKRSAGGTNKPLFRTLMARRQLSVFASLETTEFNDQIANDSLMLDVFERVNVPHCSEEELRAILAGNCEFLSQSRAVTVPEAVAHRALEMTSTFLLSEQEPARTLRVVELAADQLRFQDPGRAEHMLTVDDIARVVSRRSGIPVVTILGQTRKRDFPAALASAVVGQPDAVREVAIELELIAAGLNEVNKPATVLMFAGMTGVGKTELAKQIARLYSSSGTLKVYPMGNFTEPHSVSGLIGVPPGYVGHEDGGRLINDLLAEPYSVFLLDEAEKCHPNVWKPFLNLFDEGWIVDQRGRKAHGDRAIFILTTNAGDRSIAQLQKSDKTPAQIADHVRKTLSRVRHERSSQPVFPPQFLSRIRRIITFRSLSEEAMQGIANILLQRMITRWQNSRERTVHVPTELMFWLAREGHRRNEESNGEEGGRIIQKLISEHIEYEILAAAVASPEQYEHCREIRITLIPASDSVSEQRVDVEFLNETACGDGSQRSAE